MNKKLSLCLYYTGVLMGTFFMNYIIKNNCEYAEQLMNAFSNIHRLNKMNGQDLFIYLFIKRLKQITVLCILYFYVAKQILLIFFDLYIPFIYAIMLSLATYYQDSFHVFVAVLMFFPIYCFYKLFKILNIEILDYNRKNKKDGITNIAIKILITTILTIFLEISVNLKLIQEIIPHI